VILRLCLGVLAGLSGVCRRRIARYLAGLRRLLVGACSVFVVGVVLVGLFVSTVLHVSARISPSSP
jgi:hypothetical protein